MQTAFSAAKGLSPPPSLLNPHPSGRATPIRAMTDMPAAKRPLNADTIQVANVGERVMSQEDLSSGFFNINRRLEVGEKMTESIHEAVCHNAGLLDSMAKQITQLITDQKAASQVQATVVHGLETLQTKTDSDVEETRAALNLVNARDVAADTKLRFELDAMAARLDAGIDELRTKDNERKRPSS